MTSPLQQKLKINSPVVVTANRVTDGAVVYRDARNGWTTQFDQAAIVNIAEAAAALLAAANADDLNTVGAYVAPVTVSEGHVAPGNLRERIRREGPTFPLPPLAER
jgi:predicted NAD/FAD-binding protein